MAKFVPRHVTFEQIYEDLNLPDGITVSKDEMIEYFCKLKTCDYPAMMYEHYVNGKGYKEIQDDHPEYYRDSIKSCMRCARHSLRKLIIEDKKPIRDRYLLDFVNGKDIHTYPAFNWKTTVGEAIDYIETFDYQRSIRLDKIIRQMQDSGIDFYYPKFLFKKPEYPYNLYSEFLNGFNPASSNMITKDLYKLHVQNLCENPTCTFSALERNKAKIFSKQNPYFSEREKVVGYLYFQENVEVDVIADSLELPVSTVISAIFSMRRAMRTDFFKYYMFAA